MKRMQLLFLILAIVLSLYTIPASATQEKLKLPVETQFYINLTEVTPNKKDQFDIAKAYDFRMPTPEEMTITQKVMQRQREAFDYLCEHAEIAPATTPYTTIIVYLQDSLGIPCPSKADVNKLLIFFSSQ